jgi:hypothetical protein
LPWPAARRIAPRPERRVLSCSAIIAMTPCASGGNEKQRKDMYGILDGRIVA